MMIFAIDDEPKMLRLLHKAIEEAAPQAQILDYSFGSAALAAVREENLRPDVIFSDIQMPRPTGVELAAQLKTYAPNTKIVFVTGYDEYALDAFRVHASGYVIKPVDAEKIREELQNALPYRMQDAGKIQVQCFGYFEVFWRDVPLAFSRRRSKELLAFLIDRRGASCTAEEAIAALYEDDCDEKSAKQNLRNLVSDLKKTLQQINMEDVLIRKGGTLAIHPEKLICDYYRMLNGDMAALNAFRGEYMEQYSWAELTKAGLLWNDNR